MLALVTGVAGFIGSHLAERLSEQGWAVRGVDGFTAYYDRGLKEANLSALRARDDVELVEADLRSTATDDLIDDVDVVFHLAAQPGVRLSWNDFATYTEHNVEVTQRLLEAAAHHGVRRFVFASSSSVYGQVDGPIDETAPTRPFSPYGVTKLAGEALCAAYADNFSVPTVSLRLFTVYGPRQRPDMAIHRLIQAAMLDEPFTVYGDGSQIRAFTFVDDVVDAAVLAADASLPPGIIINISGGTSCSLRTVIDEVGQAVGRPVPLQPAGGQAGDVQRTDADIARSYDALQWAPRTSLRDGIAQHVAELRRRGASPRPG